MPHRIAPHHVRRVRRRTLVGRVLGQSTDTRIDVLKAYLHSAKMTDSPTEKLDLVMIEDYDHFAELVARDGVPLAREDAMDPAPEPVHRRVKLEIHIGWVGLVSAAFAVLLLDDVLALFTGFDLIPWL